MSCEECYKPMHPSQTDVLDEAYWRNDCQGKIVCAGCARKFKADERAQTKIIATCNGAHLVEVSWID